MACYSFIRSVMMRIRGIVLYIFLLCLILRTMENISGVNIQKKLTNIGNLLFGSVLNVRPETSSRLCKYGYFRIDYMTTCHKWLECSVIQQMHQHKKKVGGGIGKLVYLVKWRNEDRVARNLALVEIRESRLHHRWIVERVKLGIQNLIGLQPSKHVIQVAGYCQNGTQLYLLTEQCNKYGSLDKFIKTNPYASMPVVKRFSMAIQIVETFVFLHHESGLPKVHCDLHDPMQALSQFLITNTFRVVLNDVDEIPVDEISRQHFASCRAEPQCKMTNKAFLAPEQRYNPDECRKQDGRVPATIKADIWKIPDLTKFLLMENIKESIEQNQALNLLSVLEEIHSLCKLGNPQKRPTAKQVLHNYLKVFHQLQARFTKF